MKNITIFIFLLLSLSTLAAGQVELSPQIKKRIADATPKPLPQSPVAPKLKSDAEDENLVGKIKTVAKESQDLSGTWSYQGRHFDSITDFDENGNRVKAVYFSSNGNPYEVSVFGYVDGARASYYNTVSEGNDMDTGATLNEVTKEKHAPDPRYSYKYEYKYVGGKLAEMQMYLNTGEKGMRYVYNYTGNQMEELAYGYNGKLNQKYITVFDQKNNEVERHNIAVINLPRPDRNHLIKIEMSDEQGNWTKRTFLKITTENGKPTYEPAWVEYRAITYYRTN